MEATEEFDPRELFARIQGDTASGPTRHLDESQAHKICAFFEANHWAAGQLLSDDTHKQFEREIRQHGYLSGIRHEDVEERGAQAVFEDAAVAVIKMWHAQVFNGASS